MSDDAKPLTPAQSSLALAAAFLGWLGAGVQMGLGPLLNRAALRALIFTGRADLTDLEEAVVGAWFARLLCAFLLGAAFGGLILGRFGDRVGRVKALCASILTYSVFTALSGRATTPDELFGYRFLAGVGIGGTWPCGVALVAEVWDKASKPLVAGVMGAGANVGILLMAMLGRTIGINADTWRDVGLWSWSGVGLAALVYALVPESPRWRARVGEAEKPKEPLAVVFMPPILHRTILGVLLGAVPLVGTWSSGKWIIPWAEKAADAGPLTQAWWAAGAVIGSFVGGWLASLGRKASYFAMSLATVFLNVGIYTTLTPTDAAFLPAVFALGLVATTFFGWLPLYLPELFPTEVRATGAGVSFNFGRFASAAGVMGSAWLFAAFEGSYPRVGAACGLVYALGAVLILFAPETAEQTPRA